MPDVQGTLRLLAIDAPSILSPMSAMYTVPGLHPVVVAASMHADQRGSMVHAVATGMSSAIMINHIEGNVWCASLHLDP